MMKIVLGVLETNLNLKSFNSLILLLKDLNRKYWINLITQFEKFKQEKEWMSFRKLGQQISKRV